MDRKPGWIGEGAFTPVKKSIREGRDPRVGEEKKDIKIGVSSEDEAQVTTLEKVTKIVLLNVLELVNIVSNISLSICEVQLFFFLPKTLSSLNTSFISLKYRKNIPIYVCKSFHTTQKIPS